MAETVKTGAAAGVHDDANRRDFLFMLAGAAGAVGAGSVAWPFISSMNPAADTLALVAHHHALELQRLVPAAAADENEKAGGVQPRP